MIKTNILASRAKQYEQTLKNSMFTPELYKPIAITCGLMFFQRFSGANAFNYYAVIIFRQTLGGMNPHGATIAIGFVQLLASMLSGTVARASGCRCTHSSNDENKRKYSREIPFLTRTTKSIDFLTFRSSFCCVLQDS